MINKDYLIWWSQLDQLLYMHQLIIQLLYEKLHTLPDIWMSEYFNLCYTVSGW